MQSAIAALFVVGVVSAKVFPGDERQAMIDLVNSQPDGTWKAGGDTRFFGQPIGASKSLLGVKAGNRESIKKGVLSGKVKLESRVAANIPDEFDAGTNPAWKSCAPIINDIRDQSNCGCCWAFGGAEAASDRLCIATNGTVALPLSAQDLCFCASFDGCGGGFLEDAWDYIQAAGLVTGAQVKDDPFKALGLCKDFTLPHCHHHGPQGDDPYPAEGKLGCLSQSSPKCVRECDSNSTAPHNVYKSDKYTFSGDVVTYSSVAAIQTAIMEQGPVEAAFTVYADFENYVSGVYRHVTGQQMGGHAIKIVGWGVDGSTKYWKVQNSWNPYWGEKGYFRIVRGIDHCGIEDQVVSSSKDAVWGGGILPPPRPADKCSTSMKTYCGSAKTAGASICRGCVANFATQLASAGCTQSAEDTWCESSTA